VDDAVAQGELEQLVELLVRGVGVQIEAQLDRLEPDRHLPVDGERAAEVEVALGVHDAVRDPDLQRGRDRLERHPGARCQRFQEHVARAKQRPVAAGGRMEPRGGKCLPGAHGAADALPKRRAGAQGHERCLRLLAIALFQRLLQTAKLGTIHGCDPSRRAFRAWQGNR
jgi:hypothetical protein